MYGVTQKNFLHRKHKPCSNYPAWDRTAMHTNGHTSIPKCYCLVWFICSSIQSNM